MSSVQLKTLDDELLKSSLGGQIKAFLDYLVIEAGLSENTILGYGRDLKAFLKYCKSCNVGQITQITPSVIHKYMRLLTTKNLAESSVKRFVVAVRMFLRFGKLTGLIDHDFHQLLDSPKLWQKLPTICSVQQVINLLDAPSPQEPFYLRDRAILELLYATGMRASELTGLKISNLNLDIGYLRLEP